MRIAVGGIHAECSTYSPVLMRAEDFQVRDGREITQSDYFSFVNETGVETVPLFYASAVPGGPVARSVYGDFKTRFLDLLEAALPLDGLYLALHGAMDVEGMDDAEGDWAGAARAVVGPECIISASYDLHGNVSQRVIDQLDIFAAYRTAPHIDEFQTRKRAWSMLVRSVKKRERPGLAWVPIPVLLPGERTSTEDEPAKQLYAQLTDVDTRPGVWDSNVLVGYVWADEPRATASAVVTGNNPSAAMKAAEDIAQGWWRARADFRFGPTTGSLNEMLTLAEKIHTKPVILADSGDNPTGGGVGDRADVLKALLQRGFDGAVIGGLVDEPAVHACFAAGQGANITLRLGGSLDPQSPSVSIGAVVVRLGHAEDVRERQAVIAVGGVTVIMSARRRPYHDIADFTSLGIDPKTVRLLVVKSGYLSPELQRISHPNLMALSAGVIDQDIENLANHRRRNPTFPFQRDFSYKPTAHLSARWNDNPWGNSSGSS